MKYLNIKLKACLILGLVAFNSALLIADESNESSITKERESGGYLKLGIGYVYETGPYRNEQNGIGVFIEGAYQWENGLFVEQPGVKSKLNPGFSYGYNFYNTEHWSLDLIGNKSHGEINYGFNDGTESIELNRDGSFRGGLRATGIYDTNTIQFVVTPFSDNSEYDDGIYASLWLAKQWQIKNWNLNASIGLQYRSEEIIDYYYGVPADLATTSTPAYSAKSGINTSIKFSADYPISEDWVLETYLSHTQLADSISDSPVIYNAIQFGKSRSENITEAGLMISYVF
jgi:outer membrane protein